MTTKPKPCPCCGGAPVTADTKTKSIGIVAICYRCQIKAPIDAWNRLLVAPVAMREPVCVERDQWCIAVAWCGIHGLKVTKF